MKKYGVLIKRLVIIIFTTFLTLLFLVLFLCTGLAIGVFNDKSIQRSLSDSRYYYGLYEDIYNRAEGLLKQGGIPSSVIKDVITLDRVYSNGQNYVSSLMQQRLPDMNGNELNILLYQNINDYLKKEGIDRTNEVADRIDDIVLKISNLYKNSLELRFIDSYSEYRIEFCNLIKYLIPILLVAIGFICYILLRLHNFKKLGLWFVNYALIASTCIISIFTFILLIRNNYIDVTISPHYYRAFLVEYFRWDTLIFILVSCCTLIFSFLMIKITKYKTTK